MSLMVMTFNDNNNRRKGTFAHIDANVTVIMSYAMGATTLKEAGMQVQITSPGSTMYFQGDEGAYAWGIFHGGVSNDTSFADNANIKAGIDGFHSQMVAQITDYSSAVTAHGAKFKPAT